VKCLLTVFEFWPFTGGVHCEVDVTQVSTARPGAPGTQCRFIPGLKIETWGTQCGSVQVR
jgi:hypothetical protein